MCSEWQWFIVRAGSGGIRYSIVEVAAPMSGAERENRSLPSQHGTRPGSVPYPLATDETEKGQWIDDGAIVERHLIW